MITTAILQKIATKTNATVLEQYVKPINQLGKQAKLFDNKKRTAAFLAQIAHESGGFNFTKENLNYNARALQTVFKKYYPTDKDAILHERKPEQIANRVYANRMGNGDEQSGDGWRYRGRGLIQLTGKENYTNFAKYIQKSIDDTIKYLETPEGAVASAIWFWDKNKLNDFCDRDDFVGLTKRINGGTIGLADRQHHYDIAIKLL